MAFTHSTMVACLLIVALTNAAAAPDDQAFIGNPEAVARWEALRKTVAERDAVVKEALGALKDGNGPLATGDARLFALEVIGLFRASEAVDTLLKMVDLKAPFVVIREVQIHTGDQYPALGALAKIGRPAVSACLWELTKDQPADRRARLVWVIGETEGPDVAQFLLERDIRRRTDNAVKERLKTALEDLHKQFPDPQTPF